MTVQRDGEERTLSIRPRLPRVILHVQEDHPIAIETLGIALPIGRKITYIQPGSPADGKLQTGDELAVFEFRLNEEQANYEMYQGFRSTKDKFSNQIRSFFGLEPVDQARIVFDQKKTHTS